VAALVARAADTAGGRRRLGSSNPRLSAPTVVDAVQARHGSIATPPRSISSCSRWGDCATPDARAERLDADQAQRAAAALVSAGLVTEQKLPRANRKFVLAGPWEQLFRRTPRWRR